MLLLEEFMSSMQIALADKTFVKGLEKRSLKADDVFCLPLTAGNFLQQSDKGKRLMKVPCYKNPPDRTSTPNPSRACLPKLT